MILNIQQQDNSFLGVLEGRLDTIAAQQFTDDMQPLLDNADKQITLDCSKLEYISSSGLRAFLVLRKKVAAEGGSLTLKSISDEVKNVFVLTGFYNLFDIQK